MIKKILMQQTIGIINLSIPFIILYQIYPSILLTVSGQILCSLLIGIYVTYLHYRIAKVQVDNLKYIPTLCKPELEKIIADCFIIPNSVNLRYGYSNEMIALTIFNTISIDPILCQKFNQDTEAIKAIDIINHNIISTMSEKQKEKIEKIKTILTPEAQTFIFKHELGHVSSNYSYKRLVSIGIITIISAYIGIKTTFYFLKSFKFFAIILGMITSGITDLLLNSSFNFLFKSREEKNADFFAAKFSSSEEIKAAATFFELHQQIVNSDRINSGLMGKLPNVILTGHFDGKTRARYLRTLAENKLKANNII